MNAYISLLRPKHLIKNLLVFLPGIFAGSIFTEKNWLLGSIGFISFSLIASAGYIINDIIDIERDRLHPLKKNRPLAAATIKVRHAFILSLGLVFFGLGISFQLGIKTFGILCFYFVINWIYSVEIKSLRFLDVIVLTVFYIIRLAYGAAITNTELTGWFIITVSFACLALSLNKRQVECNNSLTDKIPGRSYSKRDALTLQILAIGFGISSLVFLNIHSFFVLEVRNPYFLAIINLIAAYLIMLYFDTSKDQSDDPVERIIKNPVTMIMALLLLALYLYEILLNR